MYFDLAYGAFGKHLTALIAAGVVATGHVEHVAFVIAADHALRTILSRGNGPIYLFIVNTKSRCRAHFKNIIVFKYVFI